MTKSVDNRQSLRFAYINSDADEVVVSNVLQHNIRITQGINQACCWWQDLKCQGRGSNPCRLINNLFELIILYKVVILLSLKSPRMSNVLFFILVILKRSCM